MPFDFSKIDQICVNVLGDTVTLRRVGRDDVQILAILSDSVDEGSADLLRDGFIAKGETVSEGDQIIVGEAVYKVGPVVVETTGAMRFRLFKVA